MSLWRNRVFVTLFTAQIVSLLGSGVTTVGLTLYVYDIAGAGSASVVLGQALMLRILAFLIFSQPAGVLADRTNRKTMLICADLGRFALVGLFPFVTATWQVYVLVFLVNALTAFFTPTFEACLPTVAGDENYVKAISLSRVASDVEAIAAPAVTGLLISLVGLRWVFWFDAATYLLSAALVASVAVPSVGDVAGRALSLKTAFSEVAFGTRLLFRVPALRLALLLSMAEATAGAAAIVVTVAYVREVLKLGETAFTSLMAGVGLGSAFTAMLVGRFAKSTELGAEGPRLHQIRHRWAASALVLGGFIMSSSLLPAIFLPPIALFACLWFLNGMGQALIAIPSGTLLAEHTQDDERGRAYAAHFALTHACWLITYPAAGFATARFGPAMAISSAGVICSAITLVAWRMSVRGEGEPRRCAEP